MKHHQPLQYLSSSFLNPSCLQNHDIMLPIHMPPFTYTYSFNYCTYVNTRSLDIYVFVYTRSLSLFIDNYINYKSTAIPICLLHILKHFKIIFTEITWETKLPPWTSNTISEVLKVFKCACMHAYIHTEYISLINMSQWMLWALSFSSFNTELIW